MASRTALFGALVFLCVCGGFFGGALFTEQPVIWVIDDFRHDLARNLAWSPRHVCIELLDRVSNCMSSADLLLIPHDSAAPFDLSACDLTYDSATGSETLGVCHFSSGVLNASMQCVNALGNTRRDGPGNSWNARACPKFLSPVAALRCYYYYVRNLWHYCSWAAISMGNVFVNEYASEWVTWRPLDHVEWTPRGIALWTSSVLSDVVYYVALFWAWNLCMMFWVMMTMDDPIFGFAFSVISHVLLFWDIRKFVQDWKAAAKIKKVVKQGIMDAVENSSTSELVNVASKGGAVLRNPPIIPLFPWTLLVLNVFSWFAPSFFRSMCCMLSVLKFFGVPAGPTLVQAGKRGVDFVMESYGAVASKCAGAPAEAVAQAAALPVPGSPTKSAVRMLPPRTEELRQEWSINHPNVDLVPTNRTVQQLLHDVQAKYGSATTIDEPFNLGGAPEVVTLVPVIKPGQTQPCKFLLPKAFYAEGGPAETKYNVYTSAPEKLKRVPKGIFAKVRLIQESGPGAMLHAAYVLVPESKKGKTKNKTRQIFAANQGGSVSQRGNRKDTAFFYGNNWNQFWDGEPEEYTAFIAIDDLVDFDHYSQEMVRSGVDPMSFWEEMGRAVYGDADINHLREGVSNLKGKSLRVFTRGKENADYTIAITDRNMPKSFAGYEDLWLGTGRGPKHQAGFYAGLEAMNVKTFEDEELNTLSEDPRWDSLFDSDERLDWEPESALPAAQTTSKVVEAEEPKAATNESLNVQSVGGAPKHPHKQVREALHDGAPLATMPNVAKVMSGTTQIGDCFMVRGLLLMNHHVHKQALASGQGFVEFKGEIYPLADMHVSYSDAHMDFVWLSSNLPRGMRSVSTADGPNADGAATIIGLHLGRVRCSAGKFVRRDGQIFVCNYSSEKGMCGCPILNSDGHVFAFHTGSYGTNEGNTSYPIPPSPEQLKPTTVLMESLDDFTRAGFIAEEVEEFFRISRTSIHLEDAPGTSSSAVDVESAIPEPTVPALRGGARLLKSGIMVQPPVKQPASESQVAGPLSVPVAAASAAVVRPAPTPVAQAQPSASGAGKAMSKSAKRRLKQRQAAARGSDNAPAAAAN